MTELAKLSLRLVYSALKSRAALQVENLALRHQLVVLQRSVKRAKIRPADRILWSTLARIWVNWENALIFVKPETVIRWQHRRFKAHWTRLCREPGRPAIAKEVQELIRTMSRMNPTWGSPHIMGELAKVGIAVSKSTVEKYMVRAPKPPSPTWRSFLKNHAKEIVSIDFLVVPTVRFTMLYVFIFLSVDRRRVVHFNVTAHPTASWTAQQVIEAFPWETAPKYLLRDRDRTYGLWFRERVRSMDIQEVLTAPRSPWQNAYSERLNGSIRRECLDHLIVLGEAHLRRILKDYFEILQPVPHPPVLGDGRTGWEEHSTARRRQSDRHSTPGRTPPPLPKESRIMPVNKRGSVFETDNRVYSLDSTTIDDILEIDHGRDQQAMLDDVFAETAQAANAV